MGHIPSTNLRQKNLTVAFFIKKVLAECPWTHQDGSEDSRQRHFVARKGSQHSPDTHAGSRGHRPILFRQQINCKNIHHYL